MDERGTINVGEGNMKAILITVLVLGMFGCYMPESAVCPSLEEMVEAELPTLDVSSFWYGEVPRPLPPEPEVIEICEPPCTKVGKEGYTWDCTGTFMCASFVPGEDPPAWTSTSVTILCGS